MIKKRLVFAGVLSIIILSAAILCLINLKNDDYSVVAVVNGKPIYEREFRKRLEANSSEIFSYFNKKYGAEDSEDFWSRNFNGEIPNEAARKKTLEDCIKIKLQQSLAEEKGIIKSGSYKEFLKELEEENRRRRGAVKEGRVIYGPEQYGETEYFSYVLSNLAINLKKAMTDKELKVSENELKEFYDKNKENRYRLQDFVKVQKISMLYVDESGAYNEELEKKAEKSIRDVKRRLDEGESFEAAAKLYNKEGAVTEQSFEPKDAKQNMISFPDLLDAALKLKEGEVSPVIKTNMDFAIIQCVDREATGYEPYDEVKETIKAGLVGMKYDEFIEKQAEKAKVEVNEKVYKKINVR